METPPNTPREFGYTIEITRENESLDEVRRAVLAHLEKEQAEHEVVIERPAKVVVKMVDELAARRLYYRMGGRFVGIPSQPFQIKPSPK